MGKQKNDKLEKIYQDMELKFKDASEEDIEQEMDKVDLQIEENNSEIEKLNETIKTKQQLIEVLQGKDESKNSPRIQKTIKDTSKELEEAQNKLKDYELKISELKNKETNLKAYSKNKDQIKQIRVIKENITKKLPEEIKKRDDSKAKIVAAEASLKEANKELSDEKLTMKMDQYQYNALCQQKTQAEKDIKEQTEIYKKAKDRVVELQTKIGKCDLAWRSLFTGKTWDDIQRRALDSNTKFTRQVDEDTKLKDKNVIQEEQLINNIAKTVNAVKEEQGEMATNNNAELPANTSKHPRWEKFKNFFKNVGHKLKEILYIEDNKEINNENKDINNEKEEINSSTMKEIPQEKRDKFLEELRIHVDKEYGKEIKEQKESKYIEQHQTKAKVGETQEKGGR